jgi:ATP-dependent exoDNAse (exonuclease V) beta subunit
VSAEQEARWWDELVAALRLPAIGQLFALPPKVRGERVELWVERPFATLRAAEPGERSGPGGQAPRVLRGTFDRVEIVHRQGSVTAARVLDFKTDWIADEAAQTALARRYRPQLLAYREALASMLQLLPTHVRADMVFLRRGEVISADDDRS